MQTHQNIKEHKSIDISEYSFKHLANGKPSNSW